MPHFLVEIVVERALGGADLADQRAFLNAAVAEGRIVLAGSLPERPGKGIAVVQADSAAEARVFYQRSPLVERGLISWTLTELRIAVGQSPGPTDTGRS
jgi:uncharacterized protein YciI